MNGSERTLRRLALAAALAPALCAAPILAPAAAADAAEMMRVMDREHDALAGKGAARLTELSQSLRPRARGDDGSAQETTCRDHGLPLWMPRWTIVPSSRRDRRIRAAPRFLSNAAYPKRAKSQMVEAAFHRVNSDWDV